MDLKNYNLTLKSILIFCFTALTIAYFVQYVLGHQPCNLCLIERYPYWGVMVLILFILIFKKFEKFILFLILLSFIFGSIVSFYHVGIEQGFFNESLVCNLKFSEESLSKEDLMKQLRNTSFISCKDVTFRFLGLSLATINTVISLVLSGIMIKILKNYVKNK